MSNTIQNNKDSLNKKDDKKEKRKSATKNKDEKGEVDTSNFTIEERLVAAVWVHERKLDKTSIAQIKINFRDRFGKAPPTKNTLYFWEKKLFSTGKVMDAKRSGRPCRRKAFIPSVKASLQQSPGLSLRARAEQLALPRTTLKKILKEDLNIKNPETNSSALNSQINGNNSKSDHDTPQCTKQSKNENTIKQKTDQQQPVPANIPCSAPIPQPPTYSFPDSLGSFPYSALQHYLYPNGNHHQSSTVPMHPKMTSDSQNYMPNAGMTPHMINHPHQHHGHHLNHHGYHNNTQMLCKYDGFHAQ